MRNSPDLATQTEADPGRYCSVWWWAQCLLALVLAFHLVSAPLHQHRHDGVAGHSTVTAQHTVNAQPAWASAEQVVTAFVARPPGLRPPDHGRTDFVTHRSLPPAGRAPPLHG